MWRGIISLLFIALLALMAPAYGGDAPKASGDNSVPKAASDAFETTVGGSVMSDYLYRGISLSKRDPSASGSVEVARGWFYASGQMYRVDLPGDPAAELTFTGGLRPEWAGVKFDLSAAYFYYPGESPPAGSPSTDYWQYGISATRRILDAFEIVGQATYAPNAWNSGAWGAYGSGGLKVDLPKFRLVQQGDVTWSLSGEVGYQAFGTTTQGNVLPAYTHWRLGVAFNYAEFSFDLSYHDTNLSKEDCFVLTGDGGGGGTRRFRSNTGGLQSGLCSRALVGTLAVEFEPPK
jgi:uncharacterized protein (TIGR02001 family)